MPGIHSVKGRCHACGHARVMPRTELCGLCLSRKQEAVLRLIELRRCWLNRDNGPMHQCTTSLASLQRKRSDYSPRITAEDVGREKLQCSVCGESHLRVLCPREHIRFPAPHNQRPAALGIDKLDDPEAAAAFWRYLYELGYVD
ncbi:hypothetical protein LCGC14_0920430 [marine sediment metagenome]|uniref:Uncharacterized protein n=1 Tax=marine sediment metagenome TaxID=412755 RepID=A0A0F9RXL6_9ZZZZ